MPNDLPDLRPGDEIPAAWLNAVRDLYYASRLTFDPATGLHAARTATGTSVALLRGERDGLWVRITGGSGPYSWVEQVVEASGGWSPGPRSGSTGVDPAYEANANPAVAAGKVVWAARDAATSRLIFTFSAC